MAFKLSKKQWECFDHRMGVLPDSINELLDYEPRPSEQAINIVLTYLSAHDIESAHQIDRRLTDWCLIEIVEGSTWVGVARCESRQVMNGAVRTLESLAKRISGLTGKEVLAPLY